MVGMNRETGAALTEREHILQSVRTIILTPVGSRIKRRLYGSVIPELIDQPLNNATMLRLYSATAAAITKWEPRVTIVSLTLTNIDGKPALDLVVSINSESITIQIGLE